MTSFCFPSVRPSFQQPRGSSERGDDKNISELGLQAAVTKFTGITTDEPVLGEILAAYDKVEKLVK
jgi:hypothetical protein